jgi:predicted RNase H-like HicB family nuclease
MKELAFHVEQDEGWFIATCHQPEMATQAESLDELIPMIRDLVACHFDPGDERLQWPIRLHFVSDPVLVPAA